MGSRKCIKLQFCMKKSMWSQRIADLCIFSANLLFLAFSFNNLLWIMRVDFSALPANSHSAFISESLQTNCFFFDFSLKSLFRASKRFPAISAYCALRHKFFSRSLTKKTPWKFFGENAKNARIEKPAPAPRCGHMG